MSLFIEGCARRQRLLLPDCVDDMGDDWRHTVAIEAVGPAGPDIRYPRFVAGERRCLFEDVGGFPGFELFLDAMNDPAHEEHEHLRKWYGGSLDRRKAPKFMRMGA